MTKILRGWFGGARRKIVPDRSAKEIEDWLIQRVATALRVDSAQIDPEAPFENYGLDSRTAISVSGELEEWLGKEVPPTLVWEYASIVSASSFLAGQVLAPSATTWGEVADIDKDS